MKQAFRLGAPVLLALSAVVLYALPGAAQQLEYRRAAVEAGESWRLLTGHWTHASLDHLAWDAVVFALLGSVLALRSPAAFWGTLLLAAPAVSLALFAGQPEWQTYRGLSGLDAALFAALAAVVWLQDRRRPVRLVAAVAVALLLAKVGWELATGTTLFTGEVQGHEVVPLAHFVGLAAGLVGAFGATERSRTTA